MLATMGRISLNIKDGMVDSRAIGVCHSREFEKTKTGIFTVRVFLLTPGVGLDKSEWVVAHGCIADGEGL